MANRFLVFIALFLLGCLLTWGAFQEAERVGSFKATALQAVAQVKQDQKVRKVNAKIDQQTPYNASKRDAIKWLLQHTTDNNY